MDTTKKELTRIQEAIEQLLASMSSWEKHYRKELSAVHPKYQSSARNLLHYMTMRDLDVATWQHEANKLGFPSYTHIESATQHCLSSLKTIVNHLAGNQTIEKSQDALTPEESAKILKRNIKAIFGSKSKKRRTRIMVTIPLETAEAPEYAKKLVKAGMNCARINCAHDTEAEWLKMIEHIKAAAREQAVKVKIMMDLGGPKLRTGMIEPGPRVARIRPDRDELGRTTNPARVRLEIEDSEPRNGEETFIAINKTFLKKLEPGHRIRFIDTRDKHCSIRIDRVDKDAAYGTCAQSSYLQSGAKLLLEDEHGERLATSKVGDMLPKEQSLLLRIGDLLHLDAEPQLGRNAVYDETGQIQSHARISCQTPEIVDQVKAGERIFFDDGQIEGRILEKKDSSLKIKIVQARENGSKLRPDKGINLPDSDLKISGLTDKDKADLAFVAKHADTVNFSFVNTEKDVEELQAHLAKHGGEHVGIILKIETLKAFRNLPRLILKAMRNYPAGVMVARGDLAVETGWNNFPIIQEEILRICEAAHFPDIWATQVLETLAKKGTPTRSEVTDAAQAQRSECVMLNKGRYTVKAIALLDQILRKMQRYQSKKTSLRPRLKNAEKLTLDHY
ncbi:pyruvate kinase [Pelagicoccus mobilis]|uniref:pyruvate kinase n=1 Tax=Pelagicoccus mobilis TaxID=415221 RepID=A0A934S192_9BACT|nr:pyruvate kinase [Pelagicoccus mobilis]MBK1877599.1 hypothetical protein [Pelagicoccus mobilis]